MNRPVVLSLSSHSRHHHRLSTIKGDLRVIKACAVGLVTIAALAGCVAAGNILAPTSVAIVLALVLAPIASALERVHVPPVVAALLTVGATISVVIAGTTMFAPSVSTLTKRAPEIVATVEQKLHPLKVQLDFVEKATQQLAGGEGQKAAGSPMIDLSSGSILSSIATTATGVIATSLYITVLTIFLLSLRKHYTQQFILLPRYYTSRLRVARICRDVRDRVSSYLFTLACINLGLVVVTAISFWAAGISDPLLWGVAYGILNFVPIIGPSIVMVAAAAVGFATGHNFLETIAPLAIILVIDTIEAYFVQPMLLARRLIVSPIAIFVTMATLVWMWGAPAAIISVPALILLHTVLLHVPSTRPFATLLATEENDRKRPIRF